MSDQECGSGLSDQAALGAVGGGGWQSVEYLKGSLSLVSPVPTIWTPRSAGASVRTCYPLQQSGEFRGAHAERG